MYYTRYLILQTRNSWNDNTIFLNKSDVLDVIFLFFFLQWFDRQQRESPWGKNSIRLEICCKLMYSLLYFKFNALRVIKKKRKSDRMKNL